MNAQRTFVYACGCLGAVTAVLMSVQCSRHDAAAPPPAEHTVARHPVHLAEQSRTDVSDRRTNASLDLVERSAGIFNRAMSIYGESERTLLRHDSPLLTCEQLSEIVAVAARNEEMSRVLMRDTYHLQSQVTTNGYVVTHPFYWRLELVLSRLWQDSPCADVRCAAAATLLNDYAKYDPATEYGGKCDALRQQLYTSLHLTEPVEADATRGISYAVLGRIDDALIRAAALRGGAQYQQEATRVMRRWLRASARDQLLRRVRCFDALTYAGTPETVRRMYLPDLLNTLSPDDVRRLLDDHTLAANIEQWKGAYTSHHKDNLTQEQSR